MMPWKIVKNGPDDKPYCVFKENEAKEAIGETLGCHATEDGAKKQLAALYVNVPEGGRSHSKPHMTMGPKQDDIERRDLLTVDVALRVDSDSGAPTVEGYAAVFDSLSEVLFEWDSGRFREKVAPGAFTKTIREQNIPLLVEHANLPLATTGAGTLQLAEDGMGLRFSSVLEPTDPDVQRLIPKMRRGDMNKCSFGFIPIRQAWDDKAKPRLRTIQEAKLVDISIVARPAYSATTAKVRAELVEDGLDPELITELLVRLRRGLPLDDDDTAMMQTLTNTFRAYLPEPVTAPEVAPLNSEHPTDGTQPTTPTSAPNPQVHPLSWYREQMTRLGA